MSTPGILATRVVQQYRRRDILTYVGLRQYLRNRSAQRDIWSQDIATALVQERDAGSYHTVPTFKEVAPNGDITFRQLFLPPPHEALAEAALLATCAEAGGPFESHPSVFSYRLSSGDERNGIFCPYFGGFIERHKAIATACRRDQTAVVIHTDVRRFYPSIRADLARQAWVDACNAANIPSIYRTLGLKMLADHKKMNGDGALLTGPMFSHMIGNLVFRPIDEQMASHAPGRYFRYVDDVAIVANPGKAQEIEEYLAGMLAAIGLELNPAKRLEVPSREWLNGEDDFDERTGPSWKSFVGRMKQLLIFYPEARERLYNQFQENGIRIRPLDYSEVQHERSYLMRISALMRRRWFRRKMRRVAVLPVVTEGMALRVQYTADAQRLLERFNNLVGFERKRALHRLRFLASRLVYLAHPDSLRQLEDALASIPEFAMVAAIFGCLRSGDITPLLRFGPAAAQAAAQPLKALSIPLICAPHIWDKISVQAYAILRLNGIMAGQVMDGLPDEPILKFCEWDERAQTLWTCHDEYFRELACVHGIARPDLNAWALETAFDRDDDLVFDMQEMMQGSS